jgi:hypothetical protein
MKIRQGFVSNSSSSSFVICLPDNFDAEKYFEEHKNDDYYRSSRLTDEILKEEYDEFTKTKEICEYDSRSFHYIRHIFGDYIVADSDTCSDGGIGIILDNNILRKIING